MSNKGFQVLKWLEGNVHQVYLDHAGYATMCMGIRTEKPVGEKISAAQCKAHNLRSWNEYKSFVESKVKRADVRNHQIDAFTILCYNIGKSGFAKSSALRAFNANKPDYLVAANMQKWNKITVNGSKQIDPILVKRRALEAAMFQSSVYANKAASNLIKGAPRPVAPDSEGFMGILGKAKTSWGGYSVGASGAIQLFSDKIHPLTINLLAVALIGLGIWFVYNRIRDAQLGEHF